jgi:DNA repair protein RadC
MATKKYKSNSVTYRLVKEPTIISKIKVTCSTDIAGYMRDVYNDIEIQESFYIVLLNTSNNTLGHQLISKGGIDSAIVDVRLIAKYAIDSLCSSIILVHNHPSGNKNPSSADINVTKKVKDAMKLFDISVLDHVILTEDSYYSFADEYLI